MRSKQYIRLIHITVNQQNWNFVGQYSGELLTSNLFIVKIIIRLYDILVLLQRAEISMISQHRIW